MILVCLRKLRETVNCRANKLSRRIKVPIIYQLTAYECGPACLTMIARYHRVQATLSDVRNYCGVGRDGISALTLIKVASVLGLHARAYSVPLSRLSSLPRPSILHWQFHHFVVLEEWNNESATIVDPARGRIRLSCAEFSLFFTGVLITIESKQRPVRSQIRVTLIHKVKTACANVAPYIRIPKSHAVQILTTAFAAQVAGLVLPLGTGFIVDRVIPTHRPHLLIVIACGVTLCLMAQAALVTIRSALLVSIRKTINYRIPADFLSHVLKLSMSFIDQRPTGDLLLRLESNTHVRDVLSGSLLSVTLDLVFVTSYLSVLLYLSPFFAAITLTIAMLQGAVYFWLSSAQESITRIARSARGRESGLAIEMLGNLATVKTLGAESKLFERWCKYLQADLDSEAIKGYMSAVQEGIQTVFWQALPWIILLLGSLSSMRHGTSIGMLFTLNTIAIMALAPFNDILSNCQQMLLLGVELDLIRDVTSAPPEQSPYIRRSDRRILAGKITMDDVSFRYTDESPYILRNISLIVEPGTSLGVVGNTGCGKSTLLQLLLGFYKPTSGVILYDDRPLEEYDLSDLRSQLGVVLQDSALFSGTLKSNLEMKRHVGADTRDLQIVTDLAGLTDFVRLLPLKYQTFLSGSTTISGGEKQRIALARALMNSPRILMLDEATSHLDSVTEQNIALNIERLRCTRIMVAHRLSTIQRSDQIIVLSNSKIVESGRHNNLLSRGGVYNSLFNAQQVAI